MAWDSLRAHNGCLSLFDMDDLATGVRRMSLKDIKPRNFQFRRVASAGPAQSSVSAGTAARVLLPSLECEEDTDAASHGDSQGVFLLVQSDSKVRVLRDQRTRDDLAKSFPEVDEAILNDVWGRTQLFCAASTILTSLVNSGHHQRATGGAAAALRLEDRRLWPSLFDEGEEGWEQVPMPDGEEWVLVEEEEMAAEQEVGVEQVEVEVMQAEEQESKVSTASGGLSYRDVLLANIMDHDTEWPMAPHRPALGVRMHVLRKPKMKPVIPEDESWGGDEENAFIDEYYLDKAVAVRTRKAQGRKRLTETGKRRMAAKLEARMAAAAGGGGEAEASDDEMAL